MPVGIVRRDAWMDVNVVLLPGAGLRYESMNGDGDHIGVVVR